MVKEQLTSGMIDAGAELVRKLDELGLVLTAAFWFFMPEINEWRLLFASPDVSQKGPRDVYARIQLAIDQLGDSASAAPLSAIGLMEADAELVKVLRTAIRTGSDVSPIRFSKNVVDGHFIEDALIYRIA